MCMAYTLQPPLGALYLERNADTAQSPQVDYTRPPGKPVKVTFTQRLSDRLSCRKCAAVYRPLNMRALL